MTDDPFRLNDDPARYLMDENEWIADTARTAGITPTPWCLACDEPYDDSHANHTETPRA